MRLEMLLAREVGHSYSLENDYDYEEEFPRIDLHDLRDGDNIFIQYFLTRKDTIIEGISSAKFEGGKLIRQYTNVDSFSSYRQL